MRLVFILSVLVLCLSGAQCGGQGKVVSPSEKTLAALPAPAGLPDYQVRVSPGGGFSIIVNGENYPVESSYSYPSGGENKLAASVSGEPGWKVEVGRSGKDTQTVGASGAFYSIKRKITKYPNRVSVKDTITNKSGEAVGIILSNGIAAEGRGIAKSYLAGNETGGAKDIKINPTVFLSKSGLGLGMIALDDVYWVQARGRYENGRAAIYTSDFALDAGASYTIEWAIYLNKSGDYYDFINQVRKDEKRGEGVTVEGGFIFAFRSKTEEEKAGPPTSDYRRLVPSKRDIDLRGAKYVSAPCLSYAADDPTVSIEGIEFRDFPKEMELVRQQADAVYAVDPSVKYMFHIAHALYATDKPSELFPDSMLTFPDGRQHDYGNSDDYYYSRDYFSKEKLDAGWRWWIFYPTKTNSFGKAMLDSVDLMMDELNCKGGFMDGFMWTYGDAWTYGEWDGHSADIDPNTKTITRKKGSVLLLSQDLLAEYAQKVIDKGGTLIANYPVFTRTVAKVKMVCDQECRSGPDVHLTHTPITLSPLGAKSGPKTEQDVYDDVRKALEGGNLYFYYGEPKITYPSVPAQMYPITIEEIHSGYVKGKERLITLHSGLYGWHKAKDLHFTYLYDNTGRLAPNRFLTTVDRTGARTQVDLRENETAVVKRVPIFVDTRTPVNALVDRYDATGIRLSLNGRGPAVVKVKPGDFPVKPRTTYTVRTNFPWRVTSDAKGVLSIPLNLNGEVEISIYPGL